MSADYLSGANAFVLLKQCYKLHFIYSKTDYRSFAQRNVFIYCPFTFLMLRLLLCPLRPANLLLDRSSSEVPSMGTVGDWMDGMRTLPCKEAFSGVSYSSCDTLAKTSTE